MGEGCISSAHGWGEGGPSLPPLPPSPLFPAALMLVEAARRTWTMTQRRTPWCLPSASGHAGGMAQSTVRLPEQTPSLPTPTPSPAASIQLPASLPFPELWVCLAPVQSLAQPCVLLSLLH